MLFETSFKEGFDYYERVIDESTGKSSKRKIDDKFEYYTEVSSGLYSYVLDSSVKLTKKLGTSKDARDNYGVLDPIYRNIRDSYWGKNKVNLAPRIWYLDIETRSLDGFPDPGIANQQISLVQIYDNKEDVIIMLGLRDWKHQQDYEFEKKVKYIKCESEIQLIENYLNIFNKLDPLIIYAWNGDGFDFPYIYNRLKNLGIDTDRLSNYGKSSLKTGEFMGKVEYNFSSNGHHYIDLMKVYRKFVLSPRPSYSLDTIAEIEIKEKKVKHDEYQTFDDFYTGNYVLPDNPSEEQMNSKIYQEALKGNWDEVKELAHSEFCFYGYKDPLLIKKIDDKLNFTSLMLMISEKMGVLLSDSLGTVKPWSQYIANRLYEGNQITPKRQEHDSPSIVGGYVKDPQVGKHKWVLSVDVNSMYPLLGMVGFNMSPETFVPKAKMSPELRDIVLSTFNSQDESKVLDITEEKWNYIKSIIKRDNVCLGINGAVFSKGKLGIIPELVGEIYSSRKDAKKIMFKYEQRKVLIKDTLKHYDEYNGSSETNKEVLEYTEEELKTLSKSKLEELLRLAENGERLWDTKQMTEKILMNSFNQK